MIPTLLIYSNTLVHMHLMCTSTTVIISMYSKRVEKLRDEKTEKIKTEAMSKLKELGKR